MVKAICKDRAIKDLECLKARSLQSATTTLFYWIQQYAEARAAAIAAKLAASEGRSQLISDRPSLDSLWDS